MVSKNIAIWIFVFICISSIAFASDGGTVNTNVTIFADITSGTTFYNADHANISIYTPDSVIFVDQEAMLEFGTGRFNYTFTPNETGNWYVFVEYYNTTARVATGSQSLEIIGSEVQDINEEINMLAIIIGIALAGIIFIYASSQIKIDEIPRGRVPEKAVLYIISLCCGVAISFLIKVFVDNSSTYSYLQTWTNSFFIVMASLLFIVMFLYFLHFVHTLFDSWVGKDDEDEGDGF